MPYFVVAKILEPIEPAERCDRYEDPLEAVLEGKGLGSVSGGGTQYSLEYEIEHVDLDVELTVEAEGLDEALHVIKTVLEMGGAPVGSELRYEKDGREAVIPFGTNEGLAIYLDGLDLPPEVYENSGINALADEINAALEPDLGSIRGSWAGPTETAVYVYGTDAEAIYAKLDALLHWYPLCQNARVVFPYQHPTKAPRAVRIPRFEP